MNDALENSSLFAQQVLWGVEPWRLVAALLLIFVGFLSKKVVKSVFGGFLRRRAGDTRAEWDDDVVDLLAAPLALCIQIVLWYAAAAIMALPTEPVNIRLFVYQGLRVALAVAACWVAFRLLDVLARALARASTKTESLLDDQLVPLLRKTLKVFVAVVVGVMIVQNLGYSVTSLIASLGIGGLALALAAKDTIANFFGSLVVFSDQPFHIGDWIEFDGVEGVVEEIGFRTTRVRRFDKSLATVPNQAFTSSTIVNHSLRPMRRLKLTVGLSYETSADQMRTFLESVRALLGSHPALHPDTRVAAFTEFGDSSLNVLVYAFTNTTAWSEFIVAQEDIMLKIMELVNAQGLEIAFPTRTVYFRDERWDGALAAAEGDGSAKLQGGAGLAKP